MQSFTYGCVLIYLILLSFTSGTLVLHEKRAEPLRDIKDRIRIEKDAVLPVRIGLKQNQNAEANAEKWLMEVSDPKSTKFGRHWTQAEVIEAFQPSPETVANVTAWLNDHGIYEFAHSDNKMWFAFDVFAKTAEAMLKTVYFEHEDDKGAFAASCDEYYLPVHLQDHIHYITPGIDPRDMTGRTLRSRLSKRSAIDLHDRHRTIKRNPYGLPHYMDRPPFNSSFLQHCAREASPQCVRALYNFDIADSSLPVSPNNSMGLFEGNGGLYSQKDLNDAYKYFASNIPNGTGPFVDYIDGSSPGKIDSEVSLDLQISTPIVYPQNTTIFYVDADSYFGNATKNWYGQFLDAVDGSFCTQEQRVNSTHGGKPQCGVFRPPNVLASCWPVGEEQIAPFRQERICNEYLKLGLQGTTVFYASGDYGVGLRNRPPFFRGVCAVGHDKTFMPFFPSGCPWVTSVGATEIHPGSTIHQPERGAEWPVLANGSHKWLGTSSGGGFSIQFHRPEYQNDAISSYFANYNPPWDYYYDGHLRDTKGRYNRNGRGIPDLSAIGTNIPVFSGGQYYPARGTSASTPLVAALFNRIIEERIRVGKGPLGFINPTLYQNPDAFNDIVGGANGYCSKDDGFMAVPGWDPMTGLGTPNYPKLLDVFMKLP